MKINNKQYLMDQITEALNTDSIEESMEDVTHLYFISEGWEIQVDKEPKEWLAEDEMEFNIRSIGKEDWMLAGVLEVE